MRPSVVLCQRWFVPLAIFSVVVLLPWSVRGAEDRGQVTDKKTVLSSQGEVRIDLPGLIRELEGTNPEIKAARERWEAAKTVVPQVQTLPDPRLQFGYQRMPMTEPLQGTMYGFGQEIPFPGKLSLKGDIAQRDAERLEQEYNATRLRLIAVLKETYFNLHFVHKSIEIVEKNKMLLMQFEKTAKSRYSVGQAAQQDVFRAQVEISRVLDRLAVLDQQKESLHAAINRRESSTVRTIGNTGGNSHHDFDGPLTGTQPPRRRVLPRVAGNGEEH